MAVTFKPWTPWGTPPADRYDPSLDAQLAASGRGFGDLVTDAGIANQRDLQDYGFAKTDLTQAQARGHEDIGDQRLDANRGFDRSLAQLGDQRFDTNRQFDRGTQDIGNRRHDEEHDYQRNVGLLQRSYRLLGANQGGQFRTAGVAGGGAALQAARKRAENQAIDRQPLDTGHERSERDLGIAQQRLGEDRGTTLDRIGRSEGWIGADRTTAMDRLGRADTRLDQDTSSGLGRLGVGLQRGVDDRSLALLRGGREQTFFGLDTASAKAAQAAATGWDPGARPSNEFVGPQGPYRTIVQGNRTLGIGPGGDVLFRRPRRRP